MRSGRCGCGCEIRNQTEAIGAAIDETRAKRGVPAAIANSLMAVTGDVFGPRGRIPDLVGLFARKLLARQMGRNSAFDHAGNLAIALVAGAVGYDFYG